FLLGFSEIYIPEQFLVMEVSSLKQSDDSPTYVPLDPTPSSTPAFALSVNTHFHIVGSVNEGDLSDSYLKCAWVQTLDDYILESGVFSCPMVSPYKDVAELTFIIYVLNSLPLESAVEFSSLLQLQSSYHNWMNASPAKRTRLKNNCLWSCISELLLSKQISCGFNRIIKDAPIPSFLARALVLIKETAHTTPSQLIPLTDEIFPSSLKTMGLFTGVDELLTQDPMVYWRSISDIKNFFSLLGLSRFTMLQTSFHAVDWALSFNTFQQSIYPRLLVSHASTFFQFRLKLWFDELPVMYRLCQRFPGLYADDSLCPNCGIFMETLEHLFICSPSPLDASASNPKPLQHKDITVELIQRFIINVPSGLPVSRVQVITFPQTTTTPVETVDASVHAPSGAKGKDKAVDFSNPTRAPSPDASKASVQSSSFRYHAAAYLRDAPDAFKSKFTTNRTMCNEVDRAFSKFSSYGSRARCEGSGDDKRILVSFFTQDDLTSITSSPCADLLGWVFVQYSPADMKRNVEAKSLFVTDIPLFLTETQVHSAFSRYGSVVRCKFSLRKHYYTAMVQFSTEDPIAQFDDTWAILCLGNSLRVCPAHYSKTQRDVRRQYVAVLAGIPKNIKEADLTDIANQVSAKAINIPLSFTSYKPKPYVYMNFFSQETLDAAIELTVSFRNRGLTWHLPDQVKNLCHVCGRHGCSPSQCSPRPAKKTSTQLDKLYSRFKAGPQRGRTSDPSRRSSSRSRSRSRNTRPNNHRTGSNSNGTQQSGSRPPTSTSSSTPVQSRSQQSQPIGRPIVTSPTQQTGPTITPEEVAALRQQIMELSKTIRSMDERIDWFSAQLESHEYRIVELENSVYPDANRQSSYENFESYQDNQEERQDSDELCNWDDVDKVPTKLPPSRSMIMQISPDTSFSHDTPANVLSSRHIPFPTSEVLQPRRPQTALHPINFREELVNLTSTQDLIHGQLGSIMSKLDGLSPPTSDTEPAPAKHSNSTSDGKSDVLLSHALHGIILTETNLCSPAHRYVCNLYLSSYNFHSWFTHSPNANRHSGVGIILHSSLAKYVVKKKFYTDRLIGLTLQLPRNRDVLLVGGYIPPINSSNRSVIANCHSTLISWIRSARSSNHSVLLGGDLNADYDQFLAQISATHQGSSPLNPLFKLLHEQQFEDLCEIDRATLSPSATFRSTSSGSLSRLDYIWTSPSFPIPHLWSSVTDLSDNFPTDHFLVTAHFDFLALQDQRAPSFIKQRQRCRTCFDFYSANSEQKEAFAAEVSSLLLIRSSSSSSSTLNQMWHQFKTALLSAGRSYFPKKTISLMKPKAIPHELEPYIHLSHCLDHYTMSLKKLTSISLLRDSWSRFFDNFEPAFKELFPDQFGLLNALTSPDDLLT
ncbi:hypothetical protein RhiirA4_431433, partial [Rhizophagus irregularis]